MKYKVLALDLDGTLTNTQKIITEKTKKALRRAITEKGIIIVLASGRPVLGIKHLAEEIELDKLGGYILAFNGGQIIDCRTGEYVFERIVPAEYQNEVCCAIRDHGVVPLTYDELGVVAEDDQDKYVIKEAYNNAIPIKKVPDLAAHVTWPVAKFMGVGEPDKLGPCETDMQKQFEGRLSVFRSEPYFLEITPPGVKKDMALGKLLEHLGCAREELMAVGDGLNDIPMLKFAGLAVAMENAYPEVKELADFVTLSNDEDGVAAAVEKFILD